MTSEATEKVCEKVVIEEMKSDENEEVCSRQKNASWPKTHQSTKHKKHRGGKSLFTII